MNHRIFHRFGLASVLILSSLVSSTAVAQNNGNANGYGATNQAGSTGNVNVVNTPSVNVANTPAVTVTNPVTIVEPAKTQVSIALEVDFTDGSKSGDSTAYNIPAGQRLVLEQFTMQCFLPGPTYVYGYIDSFTPQGITFPVMLAPALMPWAADGVNRYRAAGTTPMHWIQDSQALKFIAERSGTTGAASCYVAATGYLTPLPPQ